MLDLEIIFILGALASIIVLAVAPLAVIYAAALLALLPTLGVTLWLVWGFFASAALQHRSRYDSGEPPQAKGSDTAQQSSADLPGLPSWLSSEKARRKNGPRESSASVLAESSGRSSESELNDIS